MDKKNMKKEDALVREDAPKPLPGDLSSDTYTLYFKGLIKQKIITGLSPVAGFGIAICKEDDDNILFQMKGPLPHTDVYGWEAQFMALKLGLTKALSLGINHITICFDDQEIYELVMGRLPYAVKRIVSLVDDVQHIRRQFITSIPVLVTRTHGQAKFVFNLALESIDSDISLLRANIRGTRAEKMVSVALCRHEFSVEYMKRHIEQMLNQGSVPRCPHDGCTSSLNLISCAHLLTPKQREMWELRVKEESIPVCDRVHCPNPKCWALMSKTELTEDGVRRCCYKCHKPFCINCKVLWHSNLSCKEYKSSSRKPTTTTMWRQCRSCQHMMKLSEERITVACRCGYKFCYKCGAQWKFGGCSHHRQLVTDVVVAIVLFAIVLLVIGLDII